MRRFLGPVSRILEIEPTPLNKISFYTIELRLYSTISVTMQMGIIFSEVDR